MTVAVEGLLVEPSVLEEHIEEVVDHGEESYRGGFSQKTPRLN